MVDWYPFAAPFVPEPPPGDAVRVNAAGGGEVGVLAASWPVEAATWLKVFVPEA